jgi:hypothetical protein
LVDEKVEDLVRTDQAENETRAEELIKYYNNCKEESKYI